MKKGLIIFLILLVIISIVSFFVIQKIQNKVFIFDTSRISHPYYYDRIDGKYNYIEDPFIVDLRKGFPNCGENRHNYNRKINNINEVIVLINEVYETKIRGVEDLEYNEGFTPKEKMTWILNSFYPPTDINGENSLELSTQDDKKIFIIDYQPQNDCRKAEVIVSQIGEMSIFGCCGY
tara:strand:+ start:89 stop:622 length:534 start_codon:yes stop_codon:yes gene_type:complete